MKHLSTLIVIAVIAAIISACGNPPAPTANPIDIQSTAQAAAFTMIAQTQEAMPTATPLPPTEIPTQTALPTDTPVAVPTLSIDLSPTTAVLNPTAAPAATSSNSGGDPCHRVLSAPQGQGTTIRVLNSTNVTVTVSMFLNETAGKGACGWRTFNLNKNNDIVFTDLVQGCYNLWAWSDDPKGKFNSSGEGCINNSDKWTFVVSSAIIKFTGP